MSDEYERDKLDRKVKRRRPGKKERERERETVTGQMVTPTKPPVILAKPDRVVVPSLLLPETKTVVEQPKLPLFTLKTRDDRTSSLPPASFVDQQTHHAVYQLQPRKPSTAPVTGQSDSYGQSQSKLVSPPVMTRAIKLIDEQFSWADAAATADVLLDQSDFFVIGVVGLQGVGKSTILSLLAGAKTSDSTRSYVFRPQMPEVIEVNSHMTTGIDMFVTNERIILLDTQPILSASVLDNLIKHDKKYPPEFSSAENCAEIQSLQMLTFLLTVCHVVLVVQDWFTDTNILRFLQTAEMLKPGTQSSSHDSSEDTHDYYPHLVFVENKASREDFGFDQFSVMEELIANALNNSKLKYRGGISMANDNLLPGFKQRTNKKESNLFLLPDLYLDQNQGISSKLPGYRGCPSFELLLQSFRNQLMSMSRSLLTHATLSEKNWLHYSARQWEAIKKSSLISEYNRLLT